MKKYFLSLFLIFIFLYSCQKNKEIRNPIANINSKDSINIDNHINLKEGEIIFEKKFIPLETTEKSLIGEIKRIEIVNDTIIIFDKISNNLFLFDINGNYIKKIGEQGKGPGQFGNIRCFTIDKTNNNIILYDDSQAKIKEFNLKGSYIADEKLHVYPAYLSKINDHLILYMNKSSFYEGNKNFYDLIFVKDQKIKTQYFNFDKSFTSWFQYANPFYNVNGSLHFIDFWNSNIYKIIDQNNMKLKYHLSINSPIPLAFTKNAEVFDDNSGNYSFIYSTFLESENYLYFDLMNKQEYDKILYNKSKNEVFYLPKIVKKYENYFSPVYAYNNSFVGILSPMETKQAVEYKTIENKDLLNIAKKISYNDNPILVLYNIIKP